jgi:hypothetical protein
MELQEIDVFVGRDGEVKIEVRGVPGMSCLDLTKELEAILGGEVVSREMTVEAQEIRQESIQEQQRQWN